MVASRPPLGIAAKHKLNISVTLEIKYNVQSSTGAANKFENKKQNRQRFRVQNLLTNCFRQRS